MLFVAGASTSTLPDCFNLLNSLETNTYPMVMSYNDDCLKTVPQIANAFNIYFSSNFNHTEIPAIVYESDGSLKLDDILLSLNPSIIREMILDMKESPTITNDFLPLKLLKLCPDVFATLHHIFCSIILTRSYPEVWKSASIRPIFKNGAKNIIVNYRPISLLPKCSLLFESWSTGTFIATFGWKYTLNNSASSQKKFCLTVNRLPTICT